MYCIVHREHHWKQSGLYSSIQKLKLAINHQPVYHCFSGQRSAVWNSRHDVSFCHADHRKMGLWRPLCQFQGFVGMFTSNVTPATLGLTAINRYVKIVKTSHYKKIFSPRRSKIWLSCLWLFLALYLLIVRVTNWANIDFIQSYAVCSFDYLTIESQIVHYCITVGLLFVLPLFVGIFSYYKIFLKTNEHQHSVVSSLQNGSENGSVTN